MGARAVRRATGCRSTLPAAPASPPSVPAGTTEVWTDGACSGNPGPGGWAWAVPDGRQAAGGAPVTTNQRMEIQAALEAVRALPGPLVVVSDSTYVVNCFRDGWWRGWLARGWIELSAKKPVANRDLWEPLVHAGERPRRRHVPLGQGPLRRPDERPGGPARGGAVPGARRGGPLTATAQVNRPIDDTIRASDRAHERDAAHSSSTRSEGPARPRRHPAPQLGPDLGDRLPLPLGAHPAHVLRGVAERRPRADRLASSYALNRGLTAPLVMRPPRRADGHSLTRRRPGRRRDQPRVRYAAMEGGPGRRRGGRGGGRSRCRPR